MNSKLELKHRKYLELLPTVQDKYGFIDSDECDSLLFSGLVGCVPGVQVTINAAFDPSDHQWKRRPVECPCYPEGSKSSISRDMLLGLAWYAYFNNRVDISEQVIGYALSHCLIMGEGVLSRTFMTPGLLSTYSWISYRLGGPSRPWLRYIPQFESSKVTDFQAHLSVLHILLRNKLTGKDNYQSLLLKQAQRQPNNPLFQYAAGYRSAAESILMNPTLWPVDRLPTSLDRKSNWLPQRDYGPDWQPSSGEKKIYSGSDFLFTYWLMNNY